MKRALPEHSRLLPGIAAAISLVLATLAGPSGANPVATGNTLPAQAPDIVGEAVDLESGETVYLEHYYCTEDALKCSVFYLRPDSRLIARKRLDYQPSLKAPELTFTDFRTNREVSISPPDDEQVVDAGFDNFVRLQWQDLSDGEEIRFPFRVLGRDDPIAMRANRRDECEDGKLCLQIRLDSWLLGSLIDPIQLTYDERSQRLLRFEGISNLKNDAGRSQKVRIRYRYSDDTSSVGNSSPETPGSPPPALTEG